MLRKGLKLLLIVFWMGLIFSFSMDNDLESSRKSESIIIQVSRFVLGDKLTEEKEEFILEKLETPLRKSAHFILYLLLEVWILWFMIEFHSLSKYDYINATLMVLIYACSDEIHQLFVPGRSGELLDVLIDTMGGCCGALLYYLRRKVKWTRKSN